MLWCGRIARFHQGVVLLSVGWAFVVGNLYALFFSFNAHTANKIIKMGTIGIGLSVAIIGLLTSLLASRRFFRGSQYTV